MARRRVYPAEGGQAHNYISTPAPHLLNFQACPARVLRRGAPRPLLIDRIYLRNYRVFEEELDLDLAARAWSGCTGLTAPASPRCSSPCCGHCGARRVRPRRRFPSSGSHGECIAEVTFEHDGHIYLVRRTISGANYTVKAEAHCDGLAVAEGARDTGRYVHSVLGHGRRGVPRLGVRRAKAAGRLLQPEPGRAAQAGTGVTGGDAAGRGPRQGPGRRQASSRTARPPPRHVARPGGSEGGGRRLGGPGGGGGSDRFRGGKGGHCRS